MNRESSVRGVEQQGFRLEGRRRYGWFNRACAVSRGGVGVRVQALNSRWVD